MVNHPNRSKSGRSHIISRDELLSYIEEERWTRYASSASANRVKTLEFSNRNQFKVAVSGTIVYGGQSVTEAVEAYNEAG